MALRRQLDALVVGLLAFSVLPTHLVSAHVNVSRILMHRYQPLVNVTEEAAEAEESAAALLPLVEHDDERIRRGVAAMLLDQLDVVRRREASAGLRGADLATRSARAELEEARPSRLRPCSATSSARTRSGGGSTSATRRSRARIRSPRSMAGR